MPYYRRRYTPRRRYRRRPTRSKMERKFRRFGRRTGSTAYKALRTAQAVKSLLNVEFKSVTSGRSQTPDTTGDLILLNGIAQGDGTGQRNGKQFKMKRYDANIKVNMGASASNTALRIIIFYKWSVNNTAPIVANILSPVDVHAFYDLDEIKNFKILYDRTYQMSALTHPERNIFVRLPLYNKTIYTAGNTTGTISDIEHGALYMILLSDESTNVPNVTVRDRLRWIDN